MTYREVLLPLLDGQLSEPAVRVATALAAAGGGRIRTLSMASLASPTPTAWSYCPAELYATIEETALATVRAQSAAAAERFSHEPIEHEGDYSRSFWLTPGEIALQRALYVDIVVLALSRPVLAEQERIAGLLLAGSGRPVVMVPESARSVPAFARISIAWKASRDAARAVHDALPLLQAARSVELVTVADVDREGAANQLIADLRTHLQRKKVETSTIILPRISASIVETLTEYFDTSAPDLVVAGGYTHTRAREQRLGRVAHHLVHHARCPLLLSH